MIVAIGGAALLAGPWVWSMGRQLVEERSSRVEVGRARRDGGAPPRLGAPDAGAHPAREGAARDGEPGPHPGARAARLAVRARSRPRGRPAARCDRLDGRQDRAPAPGQRRGGRGRRRRDGRPAARAGQRLCRGRGERGAALRAAPPSRSTSRSRTTRSAPSCATRAAGFDPAAVAPDRRGIADSIIGRMERRGGSASVHSRPGGGTEVVLQLPTEGAMTDARLRGRRPRALPLRRPLRAGRRPGDRRRRRIGRGGGAGHHRAASPTSCCSTSTCPAAAAGP